MTHLYDKICCIFVKLSDWSSQPITIVLFPLICAVYLFTGGEEGRLTLILSILAISMTQMVLRAQQVETETNKLQMAEVINAIPAARNEVLNEDLAPSEVKQLKKEIEDGVS